MLSVASVFLMQGLSPLTPPCSKLCGCEYSLYIAKHVCFFDLPLHCVFLMLFTLVLTAARPRSGRWFRGTTEKGELWLLADCPSLPCPPPTSAISFSGTCTWGLLTSSKIPFPVSSPRHQLEYLFTWLFGAIAKSGHFSTSCRSHSCFCRKQRLLAKRIFLQISTSSQQLAAWGVLPQ